jgi:hypothetical protein
MGEDLNTPRFKPLRAVLALSLLALVAIVAGCGGGGGSSEDAKATIDKAFSTPIKSANLALALEANVDGLAQLQGPVTVKLSGPFQSNGKGKLPSLDWDASFSGAGQSVSGGFLSTGDQLFVNFQNQDYEVPKAQVDQINQQLATQSGQNKTLADYGIDPKNWVTDASDEGDESVNGADTTHVSATVDVEKMLTDLNKTIEQAGAMGGTPAQQLTPQQISQIKDVVKDPKMDVYVSKDDDTLRRLNVEISFEIPQDQQAQLQGATGGSIKLSLDFSDVGQPQTIQAPANAKPLNQLQGALGGLGGGTTGSTGSSGSSGSGSSGSGSSPTADQLQKYSQCLQQADPSDAAAIQECQKLLK